MIIDSHLHLPPIKKGGSFEQSKKSLLKDMDKESINYAFIIPDNVPNSLIGNLKTCLKLFENEKRIFLLGAINLNEKGQKKKLEELIKNKKIFGLKIFPGHDPIFPIDKRLFPFYELCSNYSIPLMVHTGENSNNSDASRYNDPKYILQIAKKFPKLNIIISHYFWPKLEYCYNLTKNQRNIYFDTSALADKEVVRLTGASKIKKILERTAKDNIKKVLFGSDYSCCKLKNHIDLINSLNLSKKDKEHIFWKNAVRLFKLKIKVNP